MTDIRLRVGEVVFALRAVILCLRDGKLLVEASPAVHFVNLPGGAVSTLEDLRSAAAREWQEETGLVAGKLRLVGFVENFFELGGRRWHELGAYFMAEVPEGPFTGAATTLDQPQNTLSWVDPLAELSKPLYPLVAMDLLDVPGGECRHIIHREGKAPVGQDLRLDVGGANVQVRVHLLYVQDGKLLTNTVPGSGFWFLPGGSVRLNEDSLSAAHREFGEETGVQAQGARLVGLAEGFDRVGGRQQLGLVYRMEAGEPLPMNPFPVQDAASLEFQWIPLSEIEQLSVHPPCLSKMLEVPQGRIEHSVLGWTVRPD